jgi:hypothetical protein
MYRFLCKSGSSKSLFVHFSVIFLTTRSQIPHYRGGRQARSPGATADSCLVAGVPRNVPSSSEDI